MTRRGLRMTVVCFTFVIGTMMCLPSGASATTIIWEEDFESGLGNWKISGFRTTDNTPVPGNFTVTNGVLRITGDENHSNIAEYPSTQATGTWSFDLDVTHTPHDHFYVAFFGEEMENFTGTDDFTPAYGYGIVSVTQPFGVWNEEFVFYKRLGGDTSVITLGRHFPPEIIGWHHFDITRNAEGEFNVFINGTHVKSFQDDTYTTTEVFKFAGGPGPGIDNIVVQDEIVLTPPTTTSAISTTTTTTSGTFGFELVICAFSLTCFFLFSRKRRH